MRLCVSVCVCVFLHDNSKTNSSRRLKFKYIVAYENNNFDNGHCWTEFKDKVCDFEIFLHLA